MKAISSSLPPDHQFLDEKWVTFRVFWKGMDNDEPALPLAPGAGSLSLI